MEEIVFEEAQNMKSWKKVFSIPIYKLLKWKRFLLSING